MAPIVTRVRSGHHSEGAPGRAGPGGLFGRTLGTVTSWKTVPGEDHCRSSTTDTQLAVDLPDVGAASPAATDVDVLGSTAADQSPDAPPAGTRGAIARPGSATLAAIVVSMVAAAIYRRGAFYPSDAVRRGRGLGRALGLCAGALAGSLVRRGDGDDRGPGAVVVRALPVGAPPGRVPAARGVRTRLPRRLPGGQGPRRPRPRPHRARPRRGGGGDGSGWSRRSALADRSARPTRRCVLGAGHAAHPAGSGGRTACGCAGPGVGARSAPTAPARCAVSSGGRIRRDAEPLGLARPGRGCLCRPRPTLAGGLVAAGHGCAGRCRRGGVGLGSPRPMAVDVAGRGDRRRGRPAGAPEWHDGPHRHRGRGAGRRRGRGGGAPAPAAGDLRPHRAGQPGPDAGLVRICPQLALVHHRGSRTGGRRTRRPSRWTAIPA